MAPPDFHLPDAAWSGGHLLLADDDAVAKVRRKWFSASVASKTLQCPASMAANRLIRQPDDPFGARELGTARHAAMEDFYTLPPEQRTLQALDDLIERAASKEWSIDKLDRQDKQSLKANADLRTRWIEEVTRGARAIFNVEDPTSINVHRNEWKIFTRLGEGEGIPSILKIDRTTIGADGGLEVDDFKFKDGDEEAAKKALSPPDSRYGDDYGDQQRLYVLGIEAETGDRPKRASLIYPLLAGKYDAAAAGVRHIDVSERELQKTMSRYKQAWDLLNASADRQKFETRPSALCAWCVLANSCPVAQIGVSQARDPMKRQASIEKSLAAAEMQPSAVQLGIPILRPGAAPAEARTGVAPGMTVPHHAEPIPAVGADLFPITTGRNAAGAPSVTAAAEQADEGSDEGSRPVRNADPYEGVPWPEIPPLPEAVPEGLPGASPPQAPRMWEERQAASEPAPNTKAGTMQNMQLRPEGAVYEETVQDSLNLNSYAAMAVSGFISEAYEHLEKNGQQVTSTALSRFADVLAGIVLRAQFDITGQANFQRGAQTRLRGLLRTHLAHRPAPFGQPAAVWDQWIATTQRFLTVALSEAMALYERAPIQNDSHLYFASDVAAN